MQTGRRARLYDPEPLDIALDVEVTIGDDGVMDVVWCICDDTHDLMRCNDLSTTLYRWNSMVPDEFMLYDEPNL